MPRHLWLRCGIVVVVLAALTHLVDPTRGVTPWALAAVGAMPLAIGPVVAVGRARGRALVEVLVRTASLQVAFGALLALLRLGGFFENVLKLPVEFVPGPQP